MFASEAIENRYPGCLRCPGYISVDVARTTYLETGGEWMDLPTFATTRIAANNWILHRRVGRAMEHRGMLLKRGTLRGSVYARFMPAL